MGPGTKSPTLGHITFKDVKAAYAEQARGLLDGGVRPPHRRDLPGLAADEGDARRHLRGVQASRRARARHRAGDDRALGHDAARHRDQRGADRARTVPHRCHRHELRHGAAQHDREPALPLRERARCPSPCCRTPACPRSRTARCTTTRRPRVSPRRSSTSRKISAPTSSAAAAARRPRTLSCSSKRSATSRRSGARRRCCPRPLPSTSSSPTCRTPRSSSSASASTRRARRRCATS